MPGPYPFSKRELVAILELIEAAHGCSSPGGLKELILKARGLLEADYSVCGTVRASGPDALKVLNVVNGNYPSEWCRHYLENDYSRVDPVILYQTRYAHTQSWAAMSGSVEPDKSTRQLITQATDVGLVHGISSGIYMPESRVVNVFSFSGPRDVFGLHQKKILEVLSLHFNRAFVRLGRFSGTPSGKGMLDALNA